MHALLVLRQFFVLCMFVSIYMAVFLARWRFVGELRYFAHNGYYYKTANQSMQYRCERFALFLRNPSLYREEQIHGRIRKATAS